MLGLIGPGSDSRFRTATAAIMLYPCRRDGASDMVCMVLPHQLVSRSRSSRTWQTTACSGPNVTLTPAHGRRGHLLLSAQVYAETVLNFHPCAYDAYGMTVVEAASQGAPSVVAAGGGVGATDLLSDERGEAFLLDFGVSAERLAEQVLPLGRPSGNLHAA